MPEPTTDLLTGLAHVMDISRRPDGTLDRPLIANYDIKNPTFSVEPSNGVKSFDTVIDASCNFWIRHYSPVNNGETLPVLIYYHGGGFAFMATDSVPYDHLCHRFARELPAVVISVNYRLSPEHRYPTQYEDGLEALKFIDSNSNKIQGFPADADLSRCFIAGDSAGANIGHHVTLKAIEHEFSRIRIRGVIALQPFFGGEDRTESELNVKCPLLTISNTDWFWKSFLPEGENRSHRVCDVFGANGFDISEVNFPATLVFVGGLDPLKDRGRMYYEELKRAGKETYFIDYPNAKHTFYVLLDGEEAASMVMEVRDFMHKQLATH